MKFGFLFFYTYPSLPVRYRFMRTLTHFPFYFFYQHIPTVSPTFHPEKYIGKNALKNRTLKRRHCWLNPSLYFVIHRCLPRLKQKNSEWKIKSTEKALSCTSASESVCFASGPFARVNLKIKIKPPKKNPFFPSKEHYQCCKILHFICILVFFFASLESNNVTMKAEIIC